MAEVSKTMKTKHKKKNIGFPKISVRVIKIAVGPSAPPIMPTLEEPLLPTETVQAMRSAENKRTRTRDEKNIILNIFFMHASPEDPNYMLDYVNNYIKFSVVCQAKKANNIFNNNL